MSDKAETPRCLYCGGTERLGIEHLVPRTRGGQDAPENIFQACRSCNASKNDRLPSEWRSDLPAEVYEFERIALALHPQARLEIDKQTQTAIRLPDSLLVRIDKLAVHMSESDLGKRYTRAEILRMAAFRGVQQLEAGHALLGKKKR